MSVHIVKANLNARLAELNQKIGEIDSVLREPGSPNFEEHATEHEDDEVLEDIGNSALDEITQIKAALKRIDIGVYGECTKCGQIINENRLNAIPFAAHCLECETTMEA